jgi:hypothetical protein
MKKIAISRKARNPVAANLVTGLNRAVVMVNRKRRTKDGYSKHKGGFGRPC